MDATAPGRVGTFREGVHLEVPVGNAVDVRRLICRNVAQVFHILKV